MDRTGRTLRGSSKPSKGKAEDASSRGARPGIGSRVRAARERRGWTREALAYHAGVSWAAIAQIETGRRKDVRLKTLEALSSALGVSMDSLTEVTAEPARADHAALVYRTREEFLATCLPFVEEGLDRGDAVVAVVAQGNALALRESLGTRAQGVTFEASEDWYTDPLATLQSYTQVLNDREAAGHGWVRVIGEPVWRRRSAADRRRWIRYEALINLAFATARVSFVCPYNASLPAGVLDGAHRTHPTMAGRRGANKRYQTPEELILGLDEELG